METPIETRHVLMMLKLAKTGEQIASECDPIKANLLHHAVGVASEAGELLDAVKKNFIYNKPVDRANIIEELGDLEFYMAGVREALAITREQTLIANMEKLAKRYPNYNYTDERAHNRADKTGPMHTTQDGPDNRDDRVK